MRKNIMLTDAFVAESTLESLDSARKSVNWDIVKLLYLQDLPHGEIARNTGASVAAIRSRAWRERWAESAACPETPPQPPSFQDLVSQFQFNMGISVVAATRYYANLDAKVTGGKDARDWEIARQTLIQSGRMLFGLDRDDGKPAAGWGSAGPQARTVIDITPVPVPAKPA